MEGKKRYSIRNILLTTLWICIGAGVAVLLVAGIRKKDSRVCRGIDIRIEGVNNNYFVDKGDIIKTLISVEGGDPVGKPVGSFRLAIMESELQTNTWIKAAELFFDNNEQLLVRITEREPLSRVFSIDGSSFYVDEQLSVLPLSEKFSARLPVFTGYPPVVKVQSAADSALLKDINAISLAIQKDSFLMAMIDQVDITPQRGFEMIPKIGNQLIVFGEATDIEAKFDKLKLFYRQVMVKAGWSHYSTINLQYKGQVVAKIRGAEDIVADSLRTQQLLQIMAANAEKQASDSLQNRLPSMDNNTADSSMIQHSIQRDELGQQAETDPLPAEPKAKLPEPVKRNPAPMKKEDKPPKPQVLNKQPVKAAAPKRSDY